MLTLIVQSSPSHEYEIEPLSMFAFLITMAAVPYSIMYGIWYLVDIRKRKLITLTQPGFLIWERVGSALIFSTIHSEVLISSC